MRKSKIIIKQALFITIGVLFFILFNIFPIISTADPLDNWHWRNPLPQGNWLNGITYGNDTFVTVGDSGTILTSPDGIEWTVRK